MAGNEKLSEPLILPVKPGSLSRRDKSALRKSGIIVIEHEHPAELKMLRPTNDVDGGTLLRIALGALCTDKGYGKSGEAQREAFTICLNEYLNPTQEKAKS